MSILDTAVDESLTPLVKPPITQEQLNRYTDATGDYNPIHHDEEIAHRLGLDGVIAQGMLSMAFLGQFVSQHIADIPDAYIEQLTVRFVNMVHLGDTLTCHGIVKARTGDEDTSSGQRHRRTQGHVPTHITIECWAQNQKGTKVTSGEAVVFVPLKAER
jgi:acyl dehydratase